MEFDLSHHQMGLQDHEQRECHNWNQALTTKKEHYMVSIDNSTLITEEGIVWTTPKSSP